MVQYFFPLYLSQRWDTVIVRDIWFKCRAFHINGGSGAHFLVAADSAIQDISVGTYDLRKAFAEFAMWNIFTGARAARAPVGYGYKEAAFYPPIPDSAFITHDSVPVIMSWPWPVSVPGIPLSKMDYFRSRVPQNLAANYIAFKSIFNIPDSIGILFFGFYSSSLGLNWNFGTAAVPSGNIAPYQLSILPQSPLTPITEYMANRRKS